MLLGPLVRGGKAVGGPGQRLQLLPVGGLHVLPVRQQLHSQLSSYGHSFRDERKVLGGAEAECIPGADQYVLMSCELLVLFPEYLCDRVTCDTTLHSRPNLTNHECLMHAGTP